MRPDKGASIPDMRKREHAVFMLPVFGAVLIIPPILTLFNVQMRLFGVPLEAIYLFTIWLLLIIGAAITSWRMPRSETVRDHDTKGDT